jgi:hypothetical protein
MGKSPITQKVAWLCVRPDGPHLAEDTARRSRFLCLLVPRRREACYSTTDYRSITHEQKKDDVSQGEDTALHLGDPCALLAFIIARSVSITASSAVKVTSTTAECGINA